MQTTPKCFKLLLLHALRKTDLIFLDFEVEEIHN